MWCHLAASLVRDEAGHPLHFVVQMTDITARKLAEQQSATHQRRLAEIQRIGVIAGSSLDLPAVLRLILENTTRAVNASVGMIFLKEDETLTWGASVGLSEEFVEAFTAVPVRLGEGLTGAIAVSRTPIFIPEDSSTDPRIVRSVVAREGLNSFIGVPVLGEDDEVVGVLNVITRPPARLSEDDVQFCAAVGAEVGLAVRHAQRFAEQQATKQKLRETNRRLEAFLHVNQQLVSASDEAQLMQMIVDGATTTVGVTSGAVYLQVDDGRVLLAATTPPLPDGFPEELRRAALRDHPHLAEALSARRPVSLPDVRSAQLTPAEREVMEIRKIASNLYLPILLGGHPVGALILSSSEAGHVFSDEDVAFLQGFADQAAQVIDRLRRFHEVSHHARQLEEEIWERRRVEDELRASEGKLRSYLDHSPFGVFVADDLGRYLEVNPAATAMTGYSEAELLGMAIPDILAPESLETGKAHFERVRTAGIASAAEAAYRHASGEIRYWRVVAARVNPTRFIGFKEDVTEARLVQDELRRFKIIADSAVYGMAINDLDGHFLYVNPYFARLHGHEPEDLIGRHLSVFHAPGQLSAVADTLAEGRQRGSFGPTMIWHRHRNGTEFPMLMSGVVVCDDGGRPQCLAATAIDMTAHHRAEEERDRAQAQLMQAQKLESVGRLAGGVAHDFNNMLGVILGHTEMALETVGEGSPLHADLEEIRKAAQRSADLTRQLLAFARKQTIAPTVLDVNATLRSMLNMLERLIGENIDLVWKPGTDIWPVRMDPAQVHQLMTNLCVNARDAIAGVGTIAIATENASLDADACAAFDDATPGDYVLVSVHDTGCGMAPDVLARIFEPFFTTKDVGKGTGLGLATVFGVVKQNHGFVAVTSTPGLGTRFRVYLPRHRSPATSTATEGSVRAAQPGNETILLVEDEPAIRQMTARMLERLGYTVLSAGTPSDAVRLAREHAGSIDLLLTDIVMPEMSGRDLAKDLLSRYPRMAGLFMSGYPADTFANDGALDVGVRFIQKPFSLADVSASVREALDTHPRD